jgi:four helix bundle protein
VGSGNVVVSEITSYRDLKVWQEAMALAVAIHGHLAKIPVAVRRALADQMWRSAISVPANIAEGYGRDSTGSYVQFLKVARGSLKELETHILLAQRIGVFDGRETQPLLSSSESIGKMLNALIRSLKGHSSLTRA